MPTPPERRTKPLPFATGVRGGVEDRTGSVFVHARTLAAMGRPLTPLRAVEIALVALAALGLSTAIVAAIEAVPAAYTTASLPRQAAMLGGLYFGLVVLFAVVYRRLPESRVR
jgi:hypothetical protein